MELTAGWSESVRWVSSVLGSNFGGRVKELRTRAVKIYCQEQSWRVQAPSDRQGRARTTASTTTWRPRAAVALAAGSLARAHQQGQQHLPPWRGGSRLGRHARGGTVVAASRIVAPVSLADDDFRQSAVC